MKEDAIAGQLTNLKFVKQPEPGHWRMEFDFFEYETHKIPTLTTMLKGCYNIVFVKMEENPDAL